MERARERERQRQRQIYNIYIYCVYIWYISILYMTLAIFSFDVATQISRGNFLTLRCNHMPNWKRAPCLFFQVMQLKRWMDRQTDGGYLQDPSWTRNIGQKLHITKKVVFLFFNTSKTSKGFKSTCEHMVISMSVCVNFSVTETLSTDSRASSSSQPE